jgi:taurine transport system substrate-binding protein
VVLANAKLLGGEPADVRAALELYAYPSLEEHASDRWLGGGADGGAAKALLATAEFLKAQGKVDRVLDDYAAFVTPAYAEAATKLQR